MKAEKCEFHQASFSFLGFILEGRKVRPIEEKIKAVWTGPFLKHGNNFRGFSGFKISIGDLCAITETALPLMALTSTKVNSFWTLEADAAFKRFKTLFASAPVFNQLDPTKL